MKSKSVDLEINEDNYVDNNSNFNLIIIATVKIGSNKEYNNINNNKNTNNNGSNDESVRLLMTKTLIIVIMEELLAIVILTVIMMTYRWNSMEENKT